MFFPKIGHRHCCIASLWLSVSSNASIMNLLFLSNWSSECGSFVDLQMFFFFSGDRVRYIGSLQSTGIILDGERYDNFFNIYLFSMYFIIFVVISLS